ncbi:MAG: FecR family protein [Bacteroidales bacterium]|nr:FecR family protein [Bacteroidales bacterium]
MELLKYKELLHKYRKRACTAEELNELYLWAADQGNEELIKEVLYEELDQFQPGQSAAVNVDFDNIYRNITSQINSDARNSSGNHLLPDKESRNWKQIIRIAAIFILAFTIGGVLSFFLFNRPEQPLTVTYNEIIAPLGARSEVILPDGSKVWLNAGSKIRYQDAFNKKNRDIFLEGEAYFVVAKNKQLPFNVETADLNVVALGTEFNVKAYSDEDVVETTLIEGKVSIWRNESMLKKSDIVLLEPNQKAVYVKENRKLTVEDMKAIRESKPEVIKLKKTTVYVTAEVNPAPVISWKDNKLVFKGEELSDLLVKLERKYNVTFVYESANIKQFRFTGTLEDETLTQVLDFIKLSAPIDYELEGKTVKVFENREMTKKFSNHLKKK